MCHLMAIALEKEEQPEKGKYSLNIPDKASHSSRCEYPVSKFHFSPLVTIGDLGASGEHKLGPSRPKIGQYPPATDQGMNIQ